MSYIVHADHAIDHEYKPISGEKPILMEISAMVDKSSMIRLVTWMSPR